MSKEAKVLARRIIDGHYQAGTDNQEAIDASEAIQEYAEAYHQERLKKMQPSTNIKITTAESMYDNKTLMQQIIGALVEEVGFDKMFEVVRAVKEVQNKTP